MGWVALVLHLLGLVPAFGLRTWVQLRRTGTSGFRGISGRPGSPAWWGGVLFPAAPLLGLVAPLGVITGVTPPVGLLAHPLVAVAGLVLGVAGVVVVLRMAAVVSGIALMAPAPIAVLAVVWLVVAVQIQVRVVEEPYLVRTHFSTPDRLVQ